MNWEYKILAGEIGPIGSISRMEREMIALGEHGWDLRTTTQTFKLTDAPTRAVPGPVVCVFRRAKE